jgi:ketosteroid isomerase-like protein
MSEENVEVVRRLVDAFNAFMRNELSSDAFAELHDPHIEARWHDQRTYPDAPQELRGREELIRFSEQYLSTWANLAQEPLEVVEAPGDRVLVSISQRGRGRESGVPIEIHFFEVFTIRDRKVRKIEFFRHRADALDAASLRE